MDKLDERMAEFRRSLASGDRDALIALLQQGKQLRDGLAC